MRARVYCAHPSTRDHWATDVHEQMSRSGGQFEARPSVFKSPSKLGTHLSTHCSRDERLSRPCPAREWNLDPEARYTTTRPLVLLLNILSTHIYILPT
ncbi:hypothetical protein TNCV_2289911 [Trichonephila clavipes]|uniref:Uncharacterized protein n=1 Tax=Trichonephila clavipes TaxID=2585209 RepID=A0A8X6RIV2_TRICX|nr:hypothetical protein TNCV_2289911 [Trichonephila clavipes]